MDYKLLYKNYIYDRTWVMNSCTSNILTISNDNHTVTHTPVKEHAVAYLKTLLPVGFRHVFEFEFHTVVCMAFFIGIVCVPRKASQTNILSDDQCKRHLGQPIGNFNCGLSNYGFFCSTIHGPFVKVDTPRAMWSNIEQLWTSGDKITMVIDLRHNDVKSTDEPIEITYYKNKKFLYSNKQHSRFPYENEKIHVAMSSYYCYDSLTVMPLREQPWEVGNATRFDE